MLLKNEERGKKAYNNPTVYNIGNWISSGLFDTIKGTFNAEKPLSLQHWLDSLSTTLMVAPIAQNAGGLIDDVANSAYKGVGKVNIPDKARDIANQVKSKNGAPPQGYKGGRAFNNQPANGGQKLPDGVNYKEYDVNPYVKGQNRGTERIVTGDDGSVWYTNDHYYTFTKIE